MRASLKEFFRRLLIISCIISSGFLFSQNDTTIQKLEGVEIYGLQEERGIRSAIPMQILDNKELELLPVLQVSDALKFLSGVTIKDYGGVGGLKTIAVRGFGAQHTGVAYDGIVSSDCQTGQIDLGKFSLEDVESLSLNTGNSDDIFVPARFLASASLINIKTKTPQFEKEIPLNLSLNFTGGSFGLINPSLVFENRLIKKKENNPNYLYSSVKINYLQSNGEYPFALYYGEENDSISKEKRQNSDVQTISTEANFYAGFKDNSLLNVKLYYYNSQRGLPGAIIFYNTASAQRLWDQNAFGQIHYENHFTKKIAWQINGKVNYAYQRYLDPDYLNMEGKLENRYEQFEYYLSNSLLYNAAKQWSFSLSNDLIYNDMNSDIRNFAKPQRFSSLTAISGKWTTKYTETTANLLYTYVHNQVKNGESAKNSHKLSPFLSLSVKPFYKESFYIRLFYQNIFRMPTFNDLYYREVGNINLNPENTHQLGLGITYLNSFYQKKIDFSFTADVYYNIIKDKIISIPNKNLFTWTMLNYGEVHSSGIDLNLSFSYKIIKEVSIHLAGQYTYQHAIDLTDEKSKSYKHQIPYTPRHSGSGYFTLQSKWIDLIYTILITGERYCLQQNIPTNLLPAYIDQSIGLMREFHFEKISFGIKVEVLNLAGEHYEVIKNYPMQGRSFRGSINFRF